MTDPQPLLFDRALHRRRLDRAAKRFEGADFLHQRAAEDVVDRLEAVRRDFPRVLVLGARRGALARALAPLAASGKIGDLIEADLSPAMVAGRTGARCVADEDRLPFADGAFDLVVTGPVLHWVNDLVGALIQIRLILKADGLFIGSLLGGATLSELRRAMIEAEAALSGGAGLRLSPFADAFDGAGLLQRAGFALPVADRDPVAVRYDHPLRLIADLRAMGETNSLQDRSGPALNRRVLSRAFELYASERPAPDGRVSATFERISLTGWAPHESQPKPLRPGSATMRLADALGAVERPLPTGG